jgi:hypothetical protein
MIKCKAKNCKNMITGKGKTNMCKSCALKGKTLPKSTREKMSKSHMGKTQSKSTRDNISKSNKVAMNRPETIHKMSGKNHWNYKDGKYTENYHVYCKCGKVMTGRGWTGLCRSCAKKGIKRTKETKDKMSIAQKKRFQDPKERNKTSKAKTIHGLGRFPYPLEFRFIRKSIIERDNYTCQCCGMSQEENYKKWAKDIEVHHIDYNKFNCKKNNLITLCTRCNANANQHRDYWYAYYTYIMENKQNGY